MNWKLEPQILLLLCTLAFYSCKSSKTEEYSSFSNDPQSLGEELLVDKVEPELAQHFSVEYYENYKVVKTDATFYPDGKEGESKKHYHTSVLEKIVTG